ncbi:Barstar, RNAse (barnase) inhibitor [Actinopolyspora lacussalsi subsp. righensis]|uniref:Barstar, RNAse (Barnase) inhibitor n=1 Tax=Actinopolyspora righensis TaxID=995060 RepID=A0A1I6XB45_9ACTN|nr:barstar family protein [Actinopolyspora righensis]SFT35498.1 Barstar, RNAse (barnase) inhibitor [Actinopolyspora righensis]
MIVDLSDVRTSAGLHRKLKIYFGFPDMYGMNWDAFWDAITGLVELPDEITFAGWGYFEKVLPNDARTMRDVFDEYITDPYHSHKVIRFE